MTRQIILASQSPQRKAILLAIGVPFEVIPANIDEKSIQAKDQETRASKIATAKANAISVQYPEAIVIAADTYIVDGNQALEKPESLEEARQMLRQQSGREVFEYTGVCYIDPIKKIKHIGTAITELVFRKLSEREIERYVTTEPVLTWSAAFCPAYDSGAALIDHINGSFTGFTYGLPLEVIIPLLKKSGAIA